MGYYYNELPSIEIGSLGIVFESMFNLIEYAERNISMHMHMTYELHMLFEGSARIRTENEDYILKQGEVALIVPQAYHAITNITPKFRLMSVTFQLYSVYPPKNVDEKRMHDIWEAINCSKVVLLKKQSDILRIMESLLHEKTHSGLANSYLVKAYVTEIMISLFRGIPTVLEESSHKANKSNQQTAIVKMSRKRIIEKYLYDNYRDGSVVDLAKELGLSEQHVRRYLRDNYGMSFSELISKARINESKHLLQNTNKSITEIWELVGFNSAQNFSFAFKKYSGGVSASRYRAMNR